MIRYLSTIFLAAILVTSPVFVTGSSAAKTSVKIVEETKPMMGTFVRIQVPMASGGDKKAVLGPIGKAFAEIARVENIFSVYKAESEVSRLNAGRSPEPVKVSDELFDLVERSVACSKDMKGAFDITVKPLVDIWNEAAKKKALPAREDIASALAKVGSAYITLDKANHTIAFQKEGMALDFGGVAKGYATDRAVAILKANGVKNALITSGGDTYCLGTREESQLWKVGIQHPRDKKKVFAVLQLQDTAIDTSGDYEKYFILSGKRYSHIIDPRTGYPIDNGMVSATVVANDAASADMLATALCVLGKDGLSIAEEKGLDALLISEEAGKLKAGMAGGFKEQYAKAKK